MKIKKFTIPSFDDWVKSDKEFKQRIGAYYMQIAKLANYANKEHKVTDTVFAIAVSPDDTPVSYDSKKIYFDSFIYSGRNNEQLRDWYEQQSEKANKVWSAFVENVFIENEP